MKFPVILSLFCALLTSQLAAQKLSQKSIPSKVLEALKVKYPAAEKVTWEKEKGNFEANWGGASGEAMSVTFDPSGVFIEQVEAIPVNSLPPAIQTYMKLHLPGKKITEAGKVLRATGAKQFEAEAGKKDYLFDDRGKFIRID